MERFQTGDTVRFKSGGPCMTITALGVYSGWTMRVADTVACRWFEGEKQHETVVDVALLFKRDNERFSAIKFGQYIYGEAGAQLREGALVTLQEQRAA